MCKDINFYWQGVKGSLKKTLRNGWTEDSKNILKDSIRRSSFEQDDDHLENTSVSVWDIIIGSVALGESPPLIGYRENVSTN